MTSTDNGLDYSEFNLEAYRLLEDEKKPKVKLNYNEKTGKYDIDLMSLPFRDLGSIHIVDSNTMMITEFD